MTAEEMFKELGFRKNKSICYDEQHILYEKPVMNDTDIFEVEFKNEHVVYTNTMKCCLKMPWYLIRAINKQCQELGWIDDEKTD